MVRVQFDIHERFDLMNIEIAQNLDPQDVADEVFNMMVVQDRRKLLSNLAVFWSINIVFQRQHATASAFVKQ